jgi:hypothetical protein
MRTYHPGRFEIQTTLARRTAYIGRGHINLTTREMIEVIIKVPNRNTLRVAIDSCRFISISHFLPNVLEFALDLGSRTTTTAPSVSTYASKKPNSLTRIVPSLVNVANLIFLPETSNRFVSSYGLN